MWNIERWKMRKDVKEEAENKKVETPAVVIWGLK